MIRKLLRAIFGDPLLISLASIALAASPAVDAQAYYLASRWASTASDSSTGQLGGPATVTWSIVPDGTNIDESGEPPSPSSLIGMLDIRFPNPGPIPSFPGATPDDLIHGYVSRPWFPIFASALARVGSVSGLSYLYEPKEDGMPQHISVTRGLLGVRGDVRIGGHPFGFGVTTLAYSNYPPYGEMVINTDILDSLIDPANDYRRMRNLLMHEALHSLGLKHVVSNNAAFLMEPAQSLTAIDGPQFDEILGLHRAYGDPLEKFGGNDTAATATPLGSLSAGEHLSRGTSGATTRIEPNEVDFLSIDDDSDVDYFRFSTSVAARLSLAVTPQGPLYNQSEEGGVQSLFDARRQSDLSLALFDDQLNPIAIANQTGLGSPELILGRLAPAGNYFLRVSGAQKAAQLYRLDLEATVPEPAGSVLYAIGFLPFITCRNKPGNSSHLLRIMPGARHT